MNVLHERLQTEWETGGTDRLLLIGAYVLDFLCIHPGELENAFGRAVNHESRRIYAMIELERRDEVRPVCPHCSSEVRTMGFQRLKGAVGKRYVYFCGTCRKVLGVSHRKGFWMG